MVNSIKQRQKYRLNTCVALLSIVTLYAIYTLAIKGDDGRTTHRGRKLLKYSSLEKDNDFVSEFDDENIRLDFLTDWNLNINAISNSTRCSKPSVDAFPGDFFTEKERREGAIILHLFFSVYLCIAIAIAADYYFVPSLEAICFLMNIQEDVGGASLMCIGSSAPDVFAAICGVLFTDGDVGIGTIMGASIFNILFVVGFCGVLAYEVLMLTWWPFLRDMIWYIISVLVLCIVIFDSYVYWQEALVMVIFYFLYALFLWQNKRLEKFVYYKTGDKESYEKRFRIVDYSLTDKEEDKTGNVSENDTFAENDNEISGFPKEPPDDIFKCPNTIIHFISWIVTLPIKLIFLLTIPDIRRPRCHKFVFFTFFNGMIWIGVLTYALLWMVTIIGFTLDIPDSIMGITFVALGTSVPDWFCSVFVARRGKADMAVSQSIASNTFGILFGLGTPWFIKTLVRGKDAIKISSFGMLISCFENLIIATLVIIVFKWKKFELGRKLGFFMIGGYGLYLICSIVVEVKLYLFQRPPYCKIS